MGLLMIAVKTWKSNCAVLSDSAVIFTFLSHFLITFSRGQQSKRCWLLLSPRSQLPTGSYVITGRTSHQPTFPIWYFYDL